MVSEGGANARPGEESAPSVTSQRVTLAEPYACVSFRTF